MSNFRPADIYEKALRVGCKATFEEGKKEYEKKRQDMKKKDNKLIISPSRSSFFVNMGNNVKKFIGKCHRQSFLEAKMATVTNPINETSMRRMQYGKMHEKQEHGYEEKGGILIAKNMRMEMNINEKLKVSGELDTLANLDSHKYIVEIKSYDGYYTERHIQGNKSRRGMPKYDHIAQNMYYIAMIKDIKEHADTEGVLFHYRTRGTLYPTYHTMHIEEVKDEKGNLVNAIPIINGVRIDIINMRTLLNRNIELANYIFANKLPPRDPQKCYSDEDIKYLLRIGEVSKSRYKKWQNGEIDIGDWQCSSRYCPYYNLCRGTGKDLPSNEEIMNKIHTDVNATNIDWSKEG